MFQTPRGYSGWVFSQAAPSTTSRFLVISTISLVPGYAMNQRRRVPVAGVVALGCGILAACASADAASAIPPHARQRAPLSFTASKGIPLPDAVNELASDNAPWPLTLAGSAVFVSLGTSVQVMNAATGETVGSVKPQHTLESSTTIQGPVGDDGTPTLLVSFQGQQVALASYIVHLPGHGTTPARLAAEIDAISPSARMLREFLVPLGTEPDLYGDPVLTFIGSAGHDVIATIGDDADGVSTIAVDIARRKLLWRNRSFTAQTLIGSTLLGTFDPSQNSMDSLGISDTASTDALTVEALDPGSGTAIWKQPETVAVANLAQAGPGTFLEEASDASSRSLRLSLLRLSTGQGKLLTQQPPTETTYNGSLPWSCQYDGQSAVVCYTPLDTQVFAVDGRTGNGLWQLPDPHSNRLGVYVSAVYDGMIYGHTSQGPLVLDARTGQDANDSPGIEPILVDPDLGIATDQNDLLEIYPATTFHTTTAGTSGVALLGFLLLVLSLTVAYLLPTLVAVLRRLPGTGQVAIVNVLLGLTIIGWIIALVMAARPKPPQPPRRRQTPATTAAGGPRQ